jgi:hypothetical protein
MLIDSPLSNKLTHLYSIGSYFIQNAATQSFDSTTPANTLFNIPTINIATAYKLLVGMNGINASCTNASFLIDIKITSRYTTSNLLEVNFTSASTTSINLGSIAVWIIGFNIQDAMAWPWPATIATTGNFLTNAAYSDLGNIVQLYNTFWGISTLKTNTQASLIFDSNLVVNTSISGTSFDPNFEWIFTIFQVKECDSTTPYYMMS